MIRTGEPCSVRVVCEGYLIRKGDQVVDASSSVCLIEACGRRIVVDTGSPHSLSVVKKAFESAGVAPKSVDFVVNTHLHIDHCGCNDLFEGARAVAHESEEPPAGTLKVRDSLELAPGVRAVHTPGHTEGSMSVFVDADSRYAVCGDAIPTRDNYEKHVPPFININPALAVASMDAILGWAQKVIPGHDKPFETIRKKYDD